MPFLVRGTYRDRHRCMLPREARQGDVWQCEHCGWVGRCNEASDDMTSTVWFPVEGLDRLLTLWEARRERKRKTREQGTAED